MRLRTLFDDPGLGLRLLTGQDELDRDIRWVYTTDLRDPRRYLSGGELVLTGMMWREGPEDSEPFVSALADAGIAALVAGTARLGSTPNDLVRACREHGIPLLELPVTVSFNSVSDRVVLDVAAERSAVSARAERGHGPFVAAVAEGADADELARLVSGEFGDACWIMSTMDRVVAESSPSGDTAAPLSAVDREVLVESYLRSGAALALVELPGSRMFSRFGVDQDTGVASWFVVLQGDHRSDRAVSLVAELRTALSLLRSRLDEGRRVASQTTGTVLRMAADGTGTQREISSHLSALGHDSETPTWVVSADVGGDHAASESLLAELAAALGHPVLTGQWGAEVMAVLGEPGDHEASLAALRRRIEALEPVLPSVRLSVGASAVVPSTALRGAVEEARSARLLAAHRLDRAARATVRRGRTAQRTCVVEGSEVASYQLLLAAVPDEVRESFPVRLLRGLREYDAEHQSDLVNTLEVFLACSCSWSRAASRLHVHVNTLRYRVRRIEEISGKDLTRFGDRVDLFLALELA